MKASDFMVVSEKITLREGDLFRAKGGPYYVSRDEKGGKRRVSMAARGPFRFRRLCEDGKRKWIEAWSMKEGSIAILCLSGRKSVLPGSLIPRPYYVSGRVTRKMATRIEAAKTRGSRRTKTAAAEQPAPVEQAASRRKSAVDEVLAGITTIAPLAE
jgi:hypothetical protein